MGPDETDAGLFRLAWLENTADRASAAWLGRRKAEVANSFLSRMKRLVGATQLGRGEVASVSGPTTIDAQLVGNDITTFADGNDVRVTEGRSSLIHRRFRAEVSLDMSDLDLASV
jgi:hypothetical protein